MALESLKTKMHAADSVYIKSPVSQFISNTFSKVIWDN